MSSHKTTNELEKRLDQLQSQIAAVESEVGAALFRTGADAVQSRREEYDSFERRKAEFCADIEEIRTLSEQRQRFRNDADALRQQIDSLTTKWPPLYERLGSAVADSPNAIYDTEFDPFREPIAELRRKDKDARITLDNLKDQMANQSLMNRLLTQVQHTARNKAAAQLERKIAGLYVKCGKAVFESGVLAAPAGEGNLPPQVAEAYAGCDELHSVYRKLQEQGDNCRRQLEENKRALADKGVASDNPDRRIKAINQEIDGEVRKQRELCRACGHDFSARYVDPEGLFLEDCAGAGDDIEPRLRQVAQLRRDMVVCNRKIQIIDLSAQIDSVSKKITSFRATIADNEERIADLQGRNRDLDDKIALAQSEKEQLSAALRDLESADAEEGPED